MQENRSLVDPFGRKIEYVRLSVTDRCNLRCYYCLPKGYKDFDAPHNWLGFDEIIRIVAAFGRLGVSRVRVTGGEPLVRRDLPELVAKLNILPGIEDLSLSTNAVHLARDADALKRAGIARINVSLDTLDARKFSDITSGGKLEKVLRGLMAAKCSGLSPIKINMVAMKGINDDEVEDMVDFCIDHGFTLRFIETMPVGDSGRKASEHYLDLSEVKERLRQRYVLTPGIMPGGGPARYMQVQGTDLRIGFITPLSQHFCETCNRVRLSVEGDLHLCLGKDHSVTLRPLLRAGISDEGLEQALVNALRLKPERHHFRESPYEVLRFMSKTGG